MAKDKDERAGGASRGALRRVRRPKDKDSLFTQLVQEESVFETYADLITFAATLGFLRDKKEPFELSGEPISWEVFSNAGYESVVNAIAATSSGDLEILTGDRLPERLAVFEEFANGGLAELQKEMRVGANALDTVRKGFTRGFTNCARTVHEVSVFIALGLAVSERQIPQIVEKIGNQDREWS